MVTNIYFYSQLEPYTISNIIRVNPQLLEPLMDYLWKTNREKGKEVLEWLD